mmetsp:Transcript_6693/g.14407  ORF Transcript_6693/g.14407 Transcript_6693/m.14407 type:complete len:421 (+) Transcript_6693:318-1580(+)
MKMERGPQLLPVSQLLRLIFGRAVRSQHIFFVPVLRRRKVLGRDAHGVIEQLDVDFRQLHQGFVRYQDHVVSGGKGVGGGQPPPEPRGIVSIPAGDVDVLRKRLSVPLPHRRGGEFSMFFAPVLLLQNILADGPDEDVGPDLLLLLQQGVVGTVHRRALPRHPRGGLIPYHDDVPLFHAPCVVPLFVGHQIEEVPPRIHHPSVLHRLVRVAGHGGAALVQRERQVAAEERLVLREEGTGAGLEHAVRDGGAVGGGGVPVAGARAGQDHLLDRGKGGVVAVVALREGHVLHPDLVRSAPVDEGAVAVGTGTEGLREQARDEMGAGALEARHGVDLGRQSRTGGDDAEAGGSEAGRGEAGGGEARGGGFGDGGIGIRGGGVAHGPYVGEIRRDENNDRDDGDDQVARPPEAPAFGSEVAHLG